MDLTWLGGAATRMRTRTAAVVMDPYDKSAGGTLGRPDAHIITISHDDPSRNGVAQVAPADGDPMVLSGPGEYEIRGVIIEGVRSTLIGGEGLGEGDATALRSTLWLFEAEEIRVAHLGGMGVAPTGAALDVLSVADIVFVPIGMPDVLQGADAAKAVRALEPSIVIPVGYDPSDQTALKAFVSAMAATPEEPVSRFTVNKRDVSDDTKRLVLLEARA